MLKNYRRVNLWLKTSSLAVIQLDTLPFPNLIQRSLFWLVAKGEERRSQGIHLEASSEKKSRQRGVLGILGGLRHWDLIYFSISIISQRIGNVTIDF